MDRLLLSDCYVIFLHLLWFLNCLYSINGIQDVEQTTWDLDYYLKHLKERVDQELQKAENCSQADIIPLRSSTEDNVINIVFKLQDEKFQDCFKYFNISLEKKRRKIKEVTVPYLHNRQQVVSYQFKNIPCGIYNIYVRPCYNDRSCPLFRWIYAKSFNVTTKDCLGYSQNVIIFDEKNSSKIIIITSITTLLFFMVIYGLISYYYLSGKQKFKTVGDKTSVADHDEYVIIPSNEDIKTEIQSIYIYIFHLYDERNIIKNKVEALKEHLKLLLKYLSDAATQRGLKLPTCISIKTIESELSKILFSVDDWLNDALDERMADGCLRKIIWIGSEIEEEIDDNLENLIFLEFKDKMKNNKHRCLYGYDNLFVVRLPGIHAIPRVLDNIVRGSRYDIPTRLVDLCLDLCSGPGLVSSEEKEKFKIPLQQHLEAHLGALQDV